jgi:hypothetical protein
VTDEPVLTQRSLNRALLARQLLLRPATGPLPRVLDRVGGIQAQYAPSMYVGLRARLRDFTRDSLTRALERRNVVQATLMRSTIHLVSREDYWPITLAVRDSRRRWWLRNSRRSAGAVEAAADRLRERLDEGPVHRSEIERIVGKDLGFAIGLWVEMVRVPPSGTWERRRADLFAAAEDWLGPPPEMEPAAAVAHLVRRYLSGFAPATKRDIAGFCGLPVGDVTPALERLNPRRFRSEDGQELLDVPRAPLPDPETPAPARFLPTWDATLLANCRRTQILPEEYRPLIFNTRTPHSLSTFLVDGAVAGWWRYEDGRIRMEPFRRLDRATRRELDEEAERLAEFHA